MTPTSTEPTTSRPPLDTALPTQTEKATFALGCFWSPDAKFASLPGVVRTRVGYAGGTTEDPTYDTLGDHTETVEVEYDPTETSYEDLLAVFWDSHDPTQSGWSRQYRPAVFPQNGAQQRLAEETREQQAGEIGGDTQTSIEPLDTFYPAEDYHQNYKLRRHDALMSDFKKMLPEPADFIASPAASRVNGYVSGYGTAEQLDEEIDGFGLSEDAEERLRAIVRK